MKHPGKVITFEEAVANTKKPESYVPLCKRGDLRGWPCPEICGEMCKYWCTDECKEKQDD